MAFRNVVARQRAAALARRMRNNFSPALPTEVAAPAGAALVGIGGRLYESTGVNAGSAVTVVNAGRPAAALYQAAQGGASSVVVRRGGSGGGGGGLTTHTLYGEAHTGTLDDSQAPQFLKTDGGRALTGNLTVSAGITIDGVDISAHAANPDAHHATATAGDGIGVTGQQISLLSNVAGAGLDYASGVLSVGGGYGLTVNANDVQLAASVAGAGLAYTLGVLDVGAGAGLTVNANDVALTTPGTLTVATVNSASGNHTHGVTSSSNPGAAASLLATDASGYLSLVRLTASDRLRSPLLDTASGALTLRPVTDIVLDPDSNLTKLAASVSLQSDNYASQVTGWRVTHAGEADFRYLYTDELHAKAFIADLEQALAGGQIISKSVTLLSRDFTAPVAGGTTTLYVRDLPSAENMAVFVSGDVVRLRSFSRASGALTIADCWGVVTSYTNLTNKEQSWTFTRSSGGNAGAMSAGTVVAVDSIILDYGVSGNGFHEVNAIDGAYALNSPYSQTVTWTTHPATGQTVRTRLGNLRGLFSVTGEYGLYAGDGTASTNKYLRLSSYTNEIRNIPINMYAGGDVLTLNPTDGLSFIGSTAYSYGKAITWTNTYGSTNVYGRVYGNDATGAGLGYWMTMDVIDQSNSDIAIIRGQTAYGSNSTDGMIMMYVNKTSVGNNTVAVKPDQTYFSKLVHAGAGLNTTLLAATGATFTNNVSANTFNSYQIAASGDGVILATNYAGYLLLDNWMRVGAGKGIYTAAGLHFFDGTAGWAIRSATSDSAALYMQTNNGVLRGYLLATDSNQIGFVNASGSWRLMCPNTGNLLRDGTYTIWDSGNDSTLAKIDVENTFSQMQVFQPTESADDGIKINMAAATPTGYALRVLHNSVARLRHIATGTENTLELNPIDSGTYGPCIVIQRNSNATSKPGSLALTDKNGSVWYLWVDTTGDLRIGTGRPENNDTTGTVVGSQS